MRLRHGGDPGIVITMGPKADNPSRVSDLVEAGATAVRTVFSYRTPSIHEHRANLVHDVAGGVGRDVTVIADLPGGKIRLGELDGDDQRGIRRDDTLVLTRPGTSAGVPVTSDRFFSAVSVDDELVVGDGSLVLEVTAVSDAEVECRASRGGTLESNRGLAVRGSEFDPPTITESTRESLAFVAESGAFDAVALSFVSSRSDIETARSILADHGEQLPIVAKVESAGGMESLPTITEAADAVMAARGDLALYLPWTDLESNTSEIARAARDADTPWILATQVAAGLEQFGLLTRAEMCDLLRWRREGCAAVLLSHETAFGTDPVQAVSTVRDGLTNGPQE